MIVLDTNVISNEMSARRDWRVHEWLNSHPAEDIFLTSITISELYDGVWRLEPGPKRDGLDKALGRVLTEFGDRIIAFDRNTAEHHGKLLATCFRMGRPIEIKDSMIASICLHRRATLATRNVRDFEGLGLTIMNPFEA